MPVIPKVISATNDVSDPSIIRVTWDKPTFTNDVKNYILYHRVFGTDKWSSQVVSGGTTSFDITNFVMGMPHEVYVMAIGLNGKPSKKTSLIKVVTLAGM